jgi:hypothetical protein
MLNTEQEKRVWELIEEYASQDPVLKQALQDHYLDDWILFKLIECLKKDRERKWFIDI